MKKISSFMLFVVLCAISVFAQSRNSFCGTYYNETNRACRISITNNNFYYIESLPIWTNDTLADLVWKKVDPQFIEIKYPYEFWGSDIIKVAEIVQTYDSNMNYEGIKFRIIMPETKEMCISISRGFGDTGYMKTDDVERIIYPTCKELIYPQRIKYFDLTITLVYRPIIHDTIGLYYGIGKFLLPNNKLDSNINLVEITLPFTYHYFEKYYTYGELVRVHDDTVSWKGRTFVRSE